MLIIFTHIYLTKIKKSTYYTKQTRMFLGRTDIFEVLTPKQQTEDGLPSILCLVLEKQKY